MNPKVTIIVPVYNTEKYLDKCIESIINQSLSEIELIILNDGSTDKSLDVIKRYMRYDKRIKLVDYKFNKGTGTGMIVHGSN